MESKEIIDTNETICINPKGGRGGDRWTATKFTRQNI